LSSVGACLAIVSLWLPWLGVAAGARVTAGGEVRVSSSHLTLDGWQALDVLDLFLFGAAGTALILSLAVLLGVAGPVVVWGIEACGLSATATLGFRILFSERPLGLDNELGIYVALVGALCIAVGGYVSRRVAR
jgi:hypothetical protein